MLQVARGWLNKRDRWLYWVLGVVAVGSYWPLRDVMIGFQQQVISLSNVSIHLILMFGLWGYYCEPLTKAVYMRIKRKEPPKWLSWVVLIVIVLILIQWLTLWGFETRWEYAQH